MASNINLTSAIRTNLASLQSTASLLGKTQEKLATGLKVNNALDNPASFFTSKRLNDRAADLAARKDGIGQGIQTLKSADKTIQALDKLLSNAKSLANRALDEDAERTSATFSGTATVTSGTTFTTTVSISIHITFKDGSEQTMKVSIKTGKTYADATSQLDQLSGLSFKLKASASTTDDPAKKYLAIDTTDENIKSFTIKAATDTFGIVGDATAVTTIDSKAIDARAALSKEFDELREQMQQIVNDAGYKGVNLLKKSDLEVKFNEDGSSSLKMKGVNFDVKDASGDVYVAGTTGGWATTTNISANLGQVENAISTLRTQASTFGSNLSVLEVRDQFTKDMISTLEEGAGKLVQADMNEEAANLLTLQTRQQLATTSLSMASQAEQGVLRLF